MRRPDPTWLRLVIFVGALLAVLTTLIVFRKIFFPLLLGLGIAYIFDPAVAWFERRGRSRILGVIVIVFLLALTVAGLVLYLIPAIGDQVERLDDRLPRYRERITALLEPWLARIEAASPGQVEDLQQKGIDFVQENIGRLLGFVGNLVKGTFSSVVGVLLAFLNLVFVPVFAFYLLVDWPKLKQAFRRLVPVPYRELVFARLAEVNEVVSSFIRGQLTIALVLAGINATGMLIIGVPLGLVIGILAGLANMIPYMALVVGLLPALVLCWAEFQSLPKLIAVVAVFSGAQLLEGTVLSPRILGQSVNLHPVWVLLSLIIGGNLFGFFGMLLAVPVAASIQVFVIHWIEAYRTSRIFRGEDGKPGARVLESGSESLTESEAEPDSS